MSTRPIHCQRLPPIGTTEPCVGNVGKTLNPLPIVDSPDITICKRLQRYSIYIEYQQSFEVSGNVLYIHYYY